MKLKSGLILCLTCFVSCMGKLIEVNYDGGKDSGYKVLKIRSELLIVCNTTATNSNGSKPSFLWTRDNETVSGENYEIGNNTLRIIEASKDDIGAIYRCTLDTKDQPVYKDIHLYTVPVLKKRLEKSTILMQHDVLSLHCQAEGFPSPQVTWYKGETKEHPRKITTNDTQIKTEADDKDVPGAKLEISRVEYSDRSIYTCKAHNVAGEVETSTLVRIKDRMAALWPFLGICAEVVVLCTIIFIYERKRLKKENEFSDNDIINN